MAGNVYSPAPQALPSDKFDRGVKLLARLRLEEGLALRSRRQRPPSLTLPQCGGEPTHPVVSYIFPRDEGTRETIGQDDYNVPAKNCLLNYGLNIVRMNFSHGTYEYHQSVLETPKNSCPATIVEGNSVNQHTNLRLANAKLRNSDRPARDNTKNIPYGRIEPLMDPLLTSRSVGSRKNDDRGSPSLESKTSASIPVAHIFAPSNIMAEFSRHIPSDCSRSSWLSGPAIFDGRFFNTSPTESSQMDPLQRLVLMTAYEVLEQGRISLEATSSLGWLHSDVSKRLQMLQLVISTYQYHKLSIWAWIAAYGTVKALCSTLGHGSNVKGYSRSWRAVPLVPLESLADSQGTLYIQPCYAKASCKTLTQPDDKTEAMN